MTDADIDKALELSLSLANDLRDVAVTAEKIGAFCAEHGLAEETSFQVQVAVEELVTNTISYGYDDDGEHRIELALRLEGGTLIVEIVDDGRTFDPLQAPRPDIGASLQDRAIGGLGIHLVRKTMDTVTYRRHEGRNVVTLTKRTAADEKS